MKLLVNLDLKFDLKFEISDRKNLVKLGGGLFYLPGKHGENFGNISEQISGNFGNFVSHFATFFGNFVQQKGGAKKRRSFGLHRHPHLFVKRPMCFMCSMLFCCAGSWEFRAEVFAEVFLALRL